MHYVHHSRFPCAGRETPVLRSAARVRSLLGLGVLAGAGGAFDRLAPPMTTPDRSAVAGLWPPEAIEAIRLASLALLERVGVQVDSARAQELLVAAGC